MIESVSFTGGPSVTIKSHHNVGGLPEKLKLKIVEPLRMLFKDEVRRVGRELEVPSAILNRHPFPGPGLGIRILGDITPEKVQLLQEADPRTTAAMLADWERKTPGRIENTFRALTDVRPSQLADRTLFDFAALGARGERSDAHGWLAGEAVDAGPTASRERVRNALSGLDILEA